MELYLPSHYMMLMQRDCKVVAEYFLLQCQIITELTCCISCMEFIHPYTCKHKGGKRDGKGDKIFSCPLGISSMVVSVSSLLFYFHRFLFIHVFICKTVSLTLRQENRLRVFVVNSVLRIFGPKSKED